LTVPVLVLVTAGYLEVTFGLAQHTWAWNVSHLEHLAKHWRDTTEPLQTVSIPADREPGQRYLLVLGGSLAVSLLGLLAWGWLWFRSSPCTPGGSVRVSSA